MARTKKDESEQIPVRRRSRDYTIISLLVPRGFSERVSEAARKSGYTKSAYIMNAVEDRLAGTTSLQLKEQLDNIERKVDSIVTFTATVIQNNAKNAKD